MDEAVLATLRAADPAVWQRAAAAFALVSQRLESVHAGLQTTGGQVDRAWPAGGGAGIAVDRLAAHARAVLAAQPLAQRVADALREHAHTLARLRDLARQELTATQAAELLARARELDARTSAVLAANAPAPLPVRWGAPAPDRLAPGPVPRASIEAQLVRAPDEVRAWWAGLTEKQRGWAIQDYPRLVGWLDGVPAVDRDRANRAVLDERLGQLAEREADLVAHLRWPTGGAPALGGPAAALLNEWLERVRAERAELQTVRAVLAGHGDRALLLGIDDAGDGRVVVALGNPDHARYTAVLVPGANADLADTPGGVQRVQRLWEEADALTAAPGDVSAIYWLGYDAPGSFDALFDDAARAGAPQLARYVEGLRATHDAMPQQLTLVGHSYGSTVLAEAALTGRLPVSDVIALGSPGMHADRATDLGLDPRHVWAGLAADDHLGGGLGELPFVHGEEPTDPAFGANRFHVDTLGHGGYWEPNSSSLRSQAAIIVGRYDLVPLVHGTAPDLPVHGSSRPPVPR